MAALGAHARRQRGYLSGRRASARQVLRVSYNPAHANKPEPLFWSETEPIGRRDVARTLRLMSYARRDLLDLVQPIATRLLDLAPGEGQRTVRDCLGHVANAEWWYLTRLELNLPDLPRDPFERLFTARRIVEEELADLSRDRMRGIFQPVRFTRAHARVLPLLEREP